MIWAKAEKKRFFHRPRLAMMTIYTVGLCLLSLSAFAQTSEQQYSISLNEVEQLISDELVRQGKGEDVQASVIGRRSTEVVRRNVPLAMEIINLESEAPTQRFRATVRFSTEADMDRPAQKIGDLQLAGRYEIMREVPMVKFRLGSGDVIREEDVVWQKVPARTIDRDTVMEVEELVGKSPVRGLMAGRAIEHDEIQSPPIVLRRAPVQMKYSSEHISISAIGTAMEDGAMGQKIKVRNDDSGIILDARVVERGHVEVTPPVIIN